MFSKDSGFSGLKTRVRIDSIDFNCGRLSLLNRVLEQWIPSLSGQLSCLSIRVLFPSLSRSEHLACLKSHFPQIYDEGSSLQICVQISGSIKIFGDLPDHALVQRESVCELLSDRFHRRMKQIRLRTRNRYFEDSVCFFSEDVEIHYRVKPQLTGSTFIEGIYSPDLFDYKLCIDELGLFAYMAQQPTPQRSSIDYVYATQTLGCPGLLVPMDAVGLLLLNLCQQYMPNVKVTSFNYHVYGQLYTRQTIRLCATVINESQILTWAESDRYLLYHGVINL